MAGVDALIIAPSDPRVMDALLKVLIPCINSAVQSAVLTFISLLEKQEAVIDCLAMENIVMIKND